MIVIPLGLWAMLTAPILYPLAQLIEFVLPKFNPLWVYMDDEIEYDYSNADWLAMKRKLGTLTIRIRIKWKFIDIDWLLVDRYFEWLAYYMWHGFRNTMWNLKRLLKPEKAREHCIWNNEVIVQIKQDSLTRDGDRVSVRGYCLEMAGLKFITKDGKEGWYVFSGEKISKRFSTIGTSELWYRANGRLYYRYSTVRPIFNKKYWMYFAMGTTDKRHLLNFKLYKYEKL